MNGSHDSAVAHLAEQLAVLIGRRSGVSDVAITSLRGKTGGASRDLFFFDARWQESGVDRDESCVLLRDREAGPLSTSRRHEFDVLRALFARGMPVPQPLWVDEQGTDLGNPAIVLRHVAGESARSVLKQREPAVQETVDRDFVEVLARLHTQTWASDELPFLPRPEPERAALDQLQIWEDIYRATAPDGEPGVSAVLAWLRRNAPIAERVCLLHGDYRYGNLLFDSTGITAVLDWELAHFGDPAEDLVWPFRAFRTATATLMPWPDFIAVYRAATGDRVTARNWQYYRVYSAAKTAIIGLTARAGFLNGGTNDIINGHMGLNVGYHTEQALRWIDDIDGRAA
jgi:aminoglycoside phosphotransferase (APT) family kinase protein